jgi:hypothetical protein
MKLLQVVRLLAGLSGFRFQPACQHLGKSIKFAWATWRRKLRLYGARLQMLRDASAIGLEQMASNGSALGCSTHRNVIEIAH